MFDVFSIAWKRHSGDLKGRQCSEQIIRNWLVSVSLACFQVTAFLNPMGSFNKI